MSRIEKGTALLRERPKTAVYEPKPWERGVRETHFSYEAFRMYLDLPMRGERRTLGNTAKTLGRSLAYIRRIAANNNWADRARAWDAFIDNVARKAHVDEVKKAVARHARLGAAMADLGGDRIQQIIDNDALDELSPSDAMGFIKSGISIERKAIGLDGGGGGTERKLTIRIIEDDDKLPGAAIEGDFNVLPGADGDDDAED